VAWARGNEDRLDDLSVDPPGSTTNRGRLLPDRYASVLVTGLSGCPVPVPLTRRSGDRNPTLRTG
jgi:hypothetical protein